MPTLKEFFAPMFEGPRDSTFKPPAEVQALPPADDIDDMDMTAGNDMGASPAMTQDITPAPVTALEFFSKNVDSAVSKFNLAEHGFDPGALHSFAASLDSMAYQMYEQVTDPSSRQNFEADYQRIAADWSKDLVKLFEKVKKLSGHSDMV